MLTASPFPSHWAFVHRINRESARPSLMGKNCVCECSGSSLTSFGPCWELGIIRTGVHPEAFQPGEERHLQTIILGAFAEKGAGVVGARRRSPTQEAAPELMHEGCPQQGAPSRQRGHLCICHERGHPQETASHSSEAGTGSRQRGRGRL